MNLFPEIYHLILEYLLESDQVEWCKCRKSWYYELFRQRIRKLRRIISHLDLDNTRARSLLDIVTKTIEEPSKQLEMTTTDFGNSPSTEMTRYLCHFLGKIGYSLRRLRLSFQNLVDICSFKEEGYYEISELSLYLADSGLEEELLSRCFEKINVMQALVIDMSQCKYTLPHKSTIKILEIEFNQFPQPFHLNYIQHLQKLVLFQCSITDVSMLGCIPDLTLHDCHDITDISTLNDNLKISINNCVGVNDYNRSFCHSEVIDLEIFIPVSFDWTNWKHVKSLTIFTTSSTSLVLIQIPSTVLRCSLRGSITKHTNICLNQFHRLRELRLITGAMPHSLLNFGFEQLVVIELRNLSTLSTLEGLGRGKNQRVIVINCPLIKDYTPIRFVHTVTITNNNTPIQLSELDHVHTLTITTKKLIVNPSSARIYSIHTLIIQSMSLLSYHGFERIPWITIPSKSFSILQQFLEKTEKLYHQRIDLMFTDWEEFLEKEDQIIDCYHQWLASEYLFFPCPRSVPRDSFLSSFTITFLKREYR